MSASFYDLLKYAATGIASPSMIYYDKMRASTLMGGGTVQTLTGQPPLSFKADGTPLISWSMLGNGSQTGTPTPDNPVMPEFVGVRTGNLFDASLLQNNMNLDNTTGLPVSYTGRIAAPNPVDVSQYSTVAIGYVSSSSIKMMYAIFSNGELVERVTAISSGTAIDVSSADSMYICFYSTYGENINTSNVSDIMLNAGSTALPYEPFGYKIPISCAGQTTPVYLGQVQTVRRVQKLVLTGEEKFTLASSDANRTVCSTALKGVSGNYGYCTHIEWKASYASTEYNRIVWNATSGGTLYVSIANQYLDGQTLADFKAWLASEYAAGHPVTVWYVLATPETGIVNEQLAKIGTYADELHSTDAGVTILTAKGQNTLTVETDLQPSEMTIKYRE